MASDPISRLEKVLSAMEASNGEYAETDEVVTLFEAVFKSIADLRTTCLQEVEATKEATRTQLGQMEAKMRSQSRRHQQILTEKDAQLEKLTRRFSDAIATVEEGPGRVNQANIAAIHDAEDDIQEIWRQIDTLTNQETKEVVGKAPRHEWSGSSIRFEKPDGTWGEWHNLQGPPGAGGFNMFGGVGPHVERIRAGTGISISGDGQGDVIVSSTSTGGGGMSLLIATGAVDDSNTLFTFLSKPQIVAVNGANYRENHGWTWNAATLTATLDNAPGTGGDVYGLG